MHVKVCQIISAILIPTVKLSFIFFDRSNNPRFPHFKQYYFKGYHMQRFLEIRILRHSSNVGFSLLLPIKIVKYVLATLIVSDLLCKTYFNSILQQ